MRDAAHQANVQGAPLQLLSCVLIISFGSVPLFLLTSRGQEP